MVITNKNILESIFQGGTYGFFLALFIWIIFFLFSAMESFLTGDIDNKTNIQSAPFSINIFYMIVILTISSSLIKLVISVFKDCYSRNVFTGWLITGALSVLCLYLSVLGKEILFLYELDQKLFTEANWVMGLRDPIKLYLWLMIALLLLIYNQLYILVFKGMSIKKNF